MILAWVYNMTMLVFDSNPNIALAAPHHLRSTPNESRQQSTHGALARLIDLAARLLALLSQRVKRVTKTPRHHVISGSIMGELWTMRAGLK
jgi:hypothetical protein